VSITIKAVHQLRTIVPRNRNILMFLPGEGILETLSLTICKVRHRQAQTTAEK
jgi:hypothetical protein